MSLEGPSGRPGRRPEGAPEGAPKAAADHLEKAMIRRESGGVEYLVFESLAALPWLRHAVLTRRGPGGADWTFSFSPGVDPEAVASNLRLVESALGLPPVALVGQVHGAEALVLAAGDDYAPKSPGSVRAGYDAIVGRSGRSLMIRVADCQAVILADPATRLVAVVHSGWRGSAANVLGRTVEAMRSLGAEPAGMLAAVGPSLGPCCAEMVNHRSELPEELWRFKGPKPDHFDFWAASRHQLAMAGVPEASVEIAGICTRCAPGFFSYRRGDAGRFAVVAAAVPGPASGLEAAS
jgi:YfiH family protein